jgi:hypothetical protein
MRAAFLAVLCLVAFVAADADAQNWRASRGVTWSDGQGWSSSKPGRSCGDPPSTSLSVWLDARNIDGSNNATLVNNDPVTTWQDLGSNNDDPTQGTAGAKPTFISSCIGGKACVRFDGGDSLRATTASNFAFMHAAAGSTTYVLVKHTAAAGSFNAMTSTAAISSTNVGMVFVMNDSSVNEGIRTYMVNGTTSFTASSVLNVFPINFWHIATSISADTGGTDLANYVDGTVRGTGSAATYVGGNPTTALTIGGDGAGTAVFRMTGDVAQVLIYSGAHDASTQATVETWLECVYGGTPQ